MKFDVEGRIKNMRLPDGQTALLFSIFEAIMNGVQAIEERFSRENAVKEGRISVNIKRTADKKIEWVEVHDNGIGLNQRHIDSFNTCDTREKAALGGRGVGRLVWIKAFHAVSVSSNYEVEAGVAGVKFDFCPELEDSRANRVDTNPITGGVGTAIKLIQPREENAKLSMAVLARSLCHHFFPYFIANSMPLTTVTIGRREVDVGQYLSTRMNVQHKEIIDVGGLVGAMEVTHVYVDPKIARQLSNSVLLTAQGRVVESLEIERKFALRGLENRKAYACVVRSDFLDEKVDQERTSFKTRPEFIDAIRDKALEAAEKFLAPHITKIRTEQKKLVVCLLEEHPQLAISVDDVDGYVEKLSPGMSDEDIAKTLFTLLYRHEKRVRSQIKQIEHDGSQSSHQDGEIVAALMRKVTEDAKLRLAEYTIKRHQVIQIARSLLKHTGSEGKYHLESTIHDFICPMGKMLSSKNYGDHNLWLVDDLLSYYQFFASDKSLTALGLAGERKELDLLFLNPFGFRREGTTDPVVIIEFKRPGDEIPSSDPIDQVLGYIEKLREKTVRDAEGQVVSEISERTHFECIVVCDLTEGTKSRLRRSVAQHPTPDGLGFYGFSPAHNASVRVTSYSKLFRDAELRNRAFFDHLGLLPQEVARAITRSMEGSGADAGNAQHAAELAQA